ncbi:S8 family serine peptidase [Arenibacter sp. 6A1]|uniref:S8 family serine peptidase n=1 Tax=Arenibacter sp. 6A1 TaxID=2720391 RepID=UPI00144741C4|nr:S8 family serine peptidase [Arenibacter sp. 6A1]NKI26757.1 S8 family serine peptidase [Arenibacter sp. 6A1]
MTYVKPKLTALRIYLFLTFLSLVSYKSISQTPKQIQGIKEEYRTAKLGMFTDKLKQEFTHEKNTLLATANAKGWKLSEKLPDGNYSALTSIGADGTPIYYRTYSTFLNNANRVNMLQDKEFLGLELHGEDMLVGVWDAGAALVNHQEFDSRVTVKDGSELVNSHATKIMGVLVASGKDYKSKGVAYKAKAISNDWRRDKIEVAEMAANGLLLSNHSYGISSSQVPDWYFGSYIDISRDWDNIMVNAPYYLMVTAAGNAQRSGDNESPVSGTREEGYDMLLGFATSKNGVTVAAANISTDDNGILLEASIAGYSSFGPIDDGRIKPDIAAYGSNVYTTGSNSNDEYVKASGTSLATPGVTGAMLLLQEYHQKIEGRFMKAATLKGLVLHSADDVAAPGPDYTMGWGVINSKSAADVITNNGYTSLIKEETLKQGETKTYTLRANGKDPLLASISWTDPASGKVNTGTLNDMSAALVNDLDIRIQQGVGTYFPWKLNASRAKSPAFQGDNKVDPFEKITIENAQGEYTLVVTHKGQLTNESQNFSLIVSGIALNDCVLDVPQEVALTKKEITEVTFTWKANTDALFQVQYKEKEAQEWTTTTIFDAFYTMTNLVAGKDYIFKVQTFCSDRASSRYSEEYAFHFQGKDEDIEGGMDKGPVIGQDPVVDQDPIEDNKPGIVIYPNPVQEYIHFQGEVTPELFYSIISPAGNTVKKGHSVDKTIYIADMQPGLYILTLVDLEGTKSFKFYKT